MSPIARRNAALVTALLVSGVALANPTNYEPGVDPGVGYNLVSWFNFGSAGASVWENAVQSAYDAGFDEVSLSPVRFYNESTGAIAQSSSQGAELSHIAAGIARGKSLGMRVTVNPFVEPQNFTTWRGFYDPTPGSQQSSTFWSDYQQYLVDVASVAEANGADSMTVGTELRAITRNTGNNASWNSVINAVDGVFSGTLGYAANWDNYNHPNVATAIWEHSAIDFLGIDSYFQGLVGVGDADTSGAYPDPDFIATVENAWNNKLDNEILPYAAARQGGAGLPVEFTEIGYLPYNRTSSTPQGQSGPLDQDEQNMAFEGLMRALDGRRATGEFLATHIWQWDMPGSSGSLWNHNPNLPADQPNNLQTAQWLSSFVNGTNTDPGDPTDPMDPPPGATQVLYSFEQNLQGFFYPNFESEPASLLSRVNGPGATDGDYSLKIDKPTDAWTWDTRVVMSGDQLQALQAALADNDEDYLLEIDVTYVADDLPSNLSDLNLHVSLETNLDGWSQLFPFADLGGPANTTFNLEIPLSDFDLTAGIAGANLHLGFVGQFSGAASIYIDRIALTDTTFVLLDNPDFNGDGVVDAADYTVWRDTEGQTGDNLFADGNHDGVVDDLDYALWVSRFGEVISPTTTVPEPAAAMILAACVATAFTRGWRVVPRRGR